MGNSVDLPSVDQTSLMHIVEPAGDFTVRKKRFKRRDTVRRIQPGLVDHLEYRCDLRKEMG